MARLWFSRQERYIFDDEHKTAMIDYMNHLQSGGNDMINDPQGVYGLTHQLFTDAEFIQLFMLGSLAAWSAGIFVGQTLKYLAKLKG